MSAARIEIRTLGGVRALRGGTEVELRGIQPRLLLAFLVHERDREVGQAGLTEALWGDCPPPRADVALRALSSRLRAALGISLLAGRLPSRVRIPDGVLVDVACLEEAVRAGEQARAQGDARAGLKRAIAALDAYAGSFATGLEAEWLEEARREVDGVRERGLELVAACAAEVDEPWARRAALGCARELCARQPYGERAHQLLMRLLAAQGERAPALWVYEELRLRLRDELGLIPGVELRDLHATLLSDQPRVRPSRPAAWEPRNRRDRPGGADLTFVLDAVAGWKRASSESELAASSLADLSHLVPCDGIGWNDVDLAADNVELRVAPVDYDIGSQETLNRLIHQNPIVAYTEQTGNRDTVKFSDFVSAREFHRLEIYRDFYRPLEVEDQLATLLEVAPGRIVGIAFNRDRRSFTERERRLLALVRPHLAAAYRNLALRERAPVRGARSAKLAVPGE